MSVQQSDGLSARSYLRVLARWKWLVVATIAVVVGIGVAYTWTRTPIYEASSQIMYTKQINITDPLGTTYTDTTSQQADIESVPVVIGSPKMRSAAQQKMGAARAGQDYTVGATLQTASNGLYSNVVTITAASPSPQVAAAAANAYAETFIEWRKENARADVASAIQVVKDRLAEIQDPNGSQRSEYSALRSSLAQLQLLEATVSGSFAVLTPAAVPSEPVSPDKARAVVVALAIGLMAGVGLAFLLEQLDTRVRSEEQVVEKLGLPKLGHIPPLTRKDREAHPVKIVADPSGPAAEAYRLLRGNLDFASVGGEVRSLVVSSSIQGEGKSVLACNLAASMTMAGRRVILVDADLRSPRVHAYMGTPNARGLSTVVAGRDQVSDALVAVSLQPNVRRSGSLVMSLETRAERTPRLATAQARSGGAASVTAPDPWLWLDPKDQGPTLRVLPSGSLPPNPGELVASRQFADVIATLEGDSDLVIVDAPAMLPVGDVLAIAPKVDALVFLVNLARLRRPMLDRAASQLAQIPCRKLGVVLVAADSRQGYYGYESRYESRGESPQGKSSGRG